MPRCVNKIQPSQSNWNFPDSPPVPLSKPELLKLTIIMKIECITLLDEEKLISTLIEKKVIFPTHIAGRSSRSWHVVTTHVIGAPNSNFRKISVRKTI